jgi:hypothetical protein
MKSLLVSIVAAVVLMGCAHTSTSAPQSNKNKELLKEYALTVLADFNAADADKWKSHFHFPHAKVATPEVEWVSDSKTTLVDFEKIRATGWVESIANEIDVIYATDDKGLVRLNFSRINKDGNVIVTTDTILTFTKINGKWGISVFFVGASDLPLK